MTHRPFTQRLVPLLTAYLLLVSLGLPLQRIYCACVGEQWLSLTETDHECHHASAVEVNHDHSLKTCCHLPESDQDLPTAEDLHDCGDSEVLLAQLDANFLTEQDQAVSDFSQLTCLPATANLLSSRPEMLRSIPIRGPSPPAADAGRDLLVAHQTFLI